MISNASLSCLAIGVVNQQPYLPYKAGPVISRGTNSFYRGCNQGYPFITGRGPPFIAPGCVNMLGIPAAGVVTGIAKLGGPKRWIGKRDLEHPKSY